MMFLILFIGLLVPYFAVGAVYSRNRYASIMAASKQATKNVDAINAARQTIESSNRIMLEAKSTNITTLLKHHNGGCDKVRYSHIGVCNCGFISQHQNLVARSQNFIDGKVEEPNVIKPMLCWPGYGMVSYLKSGTIKPSNAYDSEYVSSLERELELGHYKFKELR